LQRFAGGARESRNMLRHNESRAIRACCRLQQATGPQRFQSQPQSLLNGHGILLTPYGARIVTLLRTQILPPKDDCEGCRNPTVLVSIANGCKSCNRPPHRVARLRQPRKHEVSLKPQNPMPKPGQVAFSPRISNPAPSVTAAVNFNYQFDAGCKKVRDIPTANDHLAAKRHAQLIARYLGPKRGFRRRRPSGDRLICWAASGTGSPASNSNESIHARSQIPCARASRKQTRSPQRASRQLSFTANLFKREFNDSGRVRYIDSTGYQLMRSRFAIRRSRCAYQRSVRCRWLAFYGAPARASSRLSILGGLAK
jgi:hypothetical protein